MKAFGTTVLSDYGQNISLVSPISELSENQGRDTEYRCGFEELNASWRVTKLKWLHEYE